MPSKLSSINPNLAYLRASPGERFDAGRWRRKTVPLEAHAEVDCGCQRADPLAIRARQERVAHQKRPFTGASHNDRLLIRKQPFGQRSSNPGFDPS